MLGSVQVLPQQFWTSTLRPCAVSTLRTPQSVGVWAVDCNDVSGHYKCHYFLPLVLFFCPLSAFLI